MSKILVFLGIASLLLLAGLSGCNIFGSGSGGSSEDHIAKGREYINDSEYAKAKIEFKAALDADPLSSDALYYYAKAYQLAEGVSIASIIRDVSKAQGSPTSIPIYSRSAGAATAAQIAHDDSVKTKIYQSSIVVVDCLDKISSGLTHGDINAHDVAFDLAIGTSIRAALKLRDTNGDGRINTSDVYLNTSSSSGGGFNLGGSGANSFQNLATSLGSSADSVNNFVGQVGDLLANAADLVTSFLGQSGADTINAGDVTKFIDDIKNSISKYYVAPAACPVGAADLTLPMWQGLCDNDGDGRYNEELLNGIDDDGDGLIDEDAVMPTHTALRNVKCSTCP